MKIWKKFYAQEKQLEGHFFILQYYLCCSNQCVQFIEKSWRIQAIENSVFEKTDKLDLAKSAVEIHLSLFNQKHSVKSASVLVGFSAPGVLAEPPNTVKTSRIMRCMECRKLTGSRCDECGRWVCPRHRQLVKTCKCGHCVSAVNRLFFVNICLVLLFVQILNFLKIIVPYTKGNFLL